MCCDVGIKVAGCGWAWQQWGAVCIAGLKLLVLAGCLEAAGAVNCEIALSLLDEGGGLWVSS